MLDKEAFDCKVADRFPAWLVNFKMWGRKTKRTKRPLARNRHGHWSMVDSIECPGRAPGGGEAAHLKMLPN